MAAFQRGDLRRTNEYTKGRLGTEYVVKAEGADLSQYDAHNFYSDEQIEAYVADLVDGRRTFTEEIAAQGLRKDIREIAHRELDAIDAKRDAVEGITRLGCAGRPAKPVLRHGGGRLFHRGVLRVPEPRSALASPPSYSTRALRCSNTRETNS